MNEQWSCDEWEEKIVARMTGELSTEEQALLNQHIKSCAYCTHELQEYELLSRHLHSLEKDIPVPILSPTLLALKQEIAQYHIQKQAQQIVEQALSQEKESRSFAKKNPLILEEEDREYAPYLGSSAERNSSQEEVSQLVELAQGGDQEAFTALYDCYRAEMHTYIRRQIHNDRDAEDLCQETFMKVVVGLPQLLNKTRFRSWLYKIARNVSKDYMYKRKNMLKSISLEQEGELPRTDEIAGRPPPRVEGPENMVCETELVKEALSEVKPRYREALWLEAFSNGTQAEKARSLHIQQGTFSAYVHRGREELEAAYRRLTEEIQKEQGGSSHQC